jgi:prolyl 4-hydroxylase
VCVCVCHLLFSDLQLLKYETGAYFNRHHDCIESHRDKQPGVRILTVFLYLNEVEAGGQTNFFNLNNGITVDPKVGRLVAWPNVQDENPHEPDMRTQHQSLLVEAGQKYAANVWIHQRDYKTADENGCI